MLLSCRVLGRGVEFAFIQTIFDNLQETEPKPIKASYLKSQKNIQVENFYKDAGMQEIKVTKDLKQYSNRLCSILRLIMISLGVNIDTKTIKNMDKWDEFITIITHFGKAIRAGQSIPVVNLQQTASEISFPLFQSSQVSMLVLASATIIKLDLCQSMTQANST